MFYENFFSCMNKNREENQRNASGNLLIFAINIVN